METHNIPDVAKVQIFCLTLTGEARLWYESLKPTEVDWQGLEDQFRHWYLKFGNTQEQLFQAVRSFHYGENAEMIDVYIKGIKQVAVLLNYGKPQILEVFKSTLPRRLYWVFFPIEDLRVAVDTAKRVLMKGEIGNYQVSQALELHL